MTFMASLDASRPNHGNHVWEEGNTLNFDPFMIGLDPNTSKRGNHDVHLGLCTCNIR
jgi:hypothetical protein